MTLELIHAAMAFVFFALWAMIGHIAVSNRRTNADRRGPQLPLSGNIGQR
jgi:hypothetical protein